MMTYVVARILQASRGRSDKLQQEQTSPNHVQGLFLSSVLSMFVKTHTGNAFFTVISFICISTVLTLEITFHIEHILRTSIT